MTTSAPPTTSRWPTSLPRIATFLACGLGLGLCASEAPPAPAPLTPFGLLGGPDPYASFSGVDSWWRISVFPERRRSDPVLPIRDDSLTHIRLGGAIDVAQGEWRIGLPWRITTSVDFDWRALDPSGQPFSGNFLHAWRLDLAGHMRFNEQIGAFARTELRHLSSEGGHRDQYWGVDLGIHLHGELPGQLCVGLGHRGFAAGPWTEEQVFPLIEWHLQPQPGLDLVIGFPRMALRWQAPVDLELSARWAYPDDIELMISGDPDPSWGWRIEAWQRTSLYAGHNSQPGDRIYVRERALAALIALRPQDWPMDLRIGPMIQLAEDWWQGNSRAKASSLGSYDTSYGLLFTGTILF